MRLMYTTALASAVMFAGPALAAGDKVEGATGMTAPEASAAQLPSHGADAGVLSENFASAGFTGWQQARDAQILRMQSGGQPVWVILMPDGFQVGAAESGEMHRGTGDLAEAGSMPERGGEADISQTLDGAEQPDLAESPDLGGQGKQPDIAEAPDLGEQAEQPDVAEGPDLGAQAEQPDVAASPDLGEQAGEADIAEAPDVGGSGIVGETQPEGFAAEIPGQLQSDLEGAGFQQIESVEGADIFHAKTEDGQTAFIIVGELSGAGFGAGGQPPIDADRPAPGGAPGAAPDLPQPAPGTPAPQPAPGQR